MLPGEKTMVLSNRVDDSVALLWEPVNRPTGTRAPDLAERFNRSRSIVANFLKQLCKHGVIAGQRSLHGAYRLAQDLRRLTVSAVIRLPDGPFQLVCCFRYRRVVFSGLLDICPIHRPLQFVQQRLVATLSKRKASWFLSMAKTGDCT